MCQLLPIDELENLKFAIVALASNHPSGSFEKEMAENACKGIKARIDWILRQLKSAGEGRKNMNA